MNELNFFETIDCIEKLRSNETYTKYKNISDSFEKANVLTILKNKAKEFGFNKTDFESELKTFEKLEEQKEKAIKKNDEKNKKIVVPDNTLSDTSTLLLMDSENKFCIYDGDLYYYSKKGLYTKNTDELDTQIINYKQNADKHFRDEVPHYIKILLHNQSNAHKETIDTNYINFKNGLFNLTTKQLEEHSKDVFTINQLNVNYYDIEKYGGSIYKEAENIVNRFLDDISCNDTERKQAILEMIGYSMTSKTDLQKSFILYGSGANGKSTLTDLVQAILGNFNCTNMNLTEITEDKFALARLRNKTLNICEEMTTKYINDSSILKNIITTNRLSSRELYKQGEEKINYAKFIFNVNELPKIADTTEGYYRRWHAISFKAHFTSNDTKNFDKNALFDERAKEYLTYISLKAYLEMLESSHTFSNTAESDKIMTAYRITNSSVCSYICDTEIGLSSLLRKDQILYRNLMYTDYKSYCKQMGFIPKSNQKFYKEILEKPYNNFISVKFYNGINRYIIDKHKYDEYIQQQNLILNEN